MCFIWPCVSSLAFFFDLIPVLLPSPLSLVKLQAVTADQGCWRCYLSIQIHLRFTSLVEIHVRGIKTGHTPFSCRQLPASSSYSFLFSSKHLGSSHFQIKAAIWVIVRPPCPTPDGSCLAPFLKLGTSTPLQYETLRICLVERFCGGNTLIDTAGNGLLFPVCIHD